MKRLVKKSTVDLNMLDMNKIRQIGEKQMEDVHNNKENYDTLIYFEYQGIDVVNPFMDETSKKVVNPIEYYGDAFLNSDFAKFTKIPNWNEVKEIEVSTPDDGDYNDKKVTKEHDDRKYW